MQVEVGGTAMLLVYPKYYFLPVKKEVRSYETNRYVENDEIETMLKVKTGESKEEWYSKLLGEIDEEFVNEQLAHTG